MTTIDDLDTPAIVIDLARVEANLKRAQAHADANGYALRPHTKTHKIPRFAQRQVELGAHGITVQKLGEAEVMADAGLADIFLPYNLIGEKKLNRLKALNDRITIAVTADSPDTVSGYAAAFANSAARPLTVLVARRCRAARSPIRAGECPASTWSSSTCAIGRVSHGYSVRIDARSARRSRVTASVSRCASEAPPAGGVPGCCGMARL